jgi:hypothetical protein
MRYKKELVFNAVPECIHYENLRAGLHNLR